MPLSRISAMAFQPTGHLVAVGLPTSGIWELDHDRGQSAPATKLIAKLSGDLFGPPVGGQVVLDQAGLVYTFSDRGVQQFTPDGTPRAFLPSVGQEPTMAISPDGRRLVTGNADGQILIFDVETQRPVAHRDAPAARAPDPQGRPNAVIQLAFERSGDRFAAVFRDGQMRSYRLDGTDDGGADSSPGSGSEITALIFHPVAGYAVTGSSRGEVKSSRVIDGVRQEWAVRVYFGGAISVFAVHPSGSPLYVAGSQGLRAIDLKTGSQLQAPVPFGTVPLRTVAVSPDGRLLVGAKEAGGFLFWRADWHEWLAEGCERLKYHELFTQMGKPGVKIDSIPGLLGIEPFYALDTCRRRVWNQK